MNSIQNQVNSMYTSVEKKTELHHVIDKDSTDSGAEMYSLEDLPRVTSLNDEEVHSIDSTMLEDDDFVGNMVSPHHYGQHHYSTNNLLSPSDDMAPLSDRRMSYQRRASAVNAVRRLSAGYNSNMARSDDNLLRADRRISIIQGPDSRSSTPSTLRRSVSAFGEITVMPVGDYDDDEATRIAVEEEIYR